MPRSGFATRSDRPRHGGHFAIRFLIQAQWSKVYVYDIIIENRTTSFVPRGAPEIPRAGGAPADRAADIAQGPRSHASDFSDHLHSFANGIRRDRGIGGESAKRVAMACSMSEASRIAGSAAPSEPTTVGLRTTWSGRNPTSQAAVCPVVWQRQSV